MKRRFEGIWIPREIWLSEDLTLQEKLFLVEISSLDNDKEKGCFANNEYFSKFFGISKTRVSIIINSLVQKGLISSFVDAEGGNKRTLKTLLNFSLRPSLTNLKDPLKQSCKYNNTVNNTENNTLTTECPLFVIFWDTYGKKVDKEKCLTKWGKLKSEEKQAIIDTVSAYVQAHPEMKFRKNPLTYLNGKCWNDELTEVKPTVKPQSLTTQKTVEIWHG